MDPRYSGRVEFTTSVGTNNTPDALSFGLGAFTVNSAFTARSATIYNGATPLGVDVNTNFGTYTGPLSLNPCNEFASATGAGLSPLSFNRD